MATRTSAPQLPLPDVTTQSRGGEVQAGVEGVGEDCTPETSPHKVEGGRFSRGGGGWGGLTTGVGCTQGVEGFQGLAVQSHGLGLVIGHPLQVGIGGQDGGVHGVPPPQRPLHCLPRYGG